MDPIKELLQQRADNLDLGRQDELATIQKELDRLFRNARATKLDHAKHTLTITVSNSSEATIVRYGHVQILHSIKDITREPVEKIIIRLR